MTRGVLMCNVTVLRLSCDIAGTETSMSRLDRVAVRQSAVITRVDDCGPIAQRLMALGLLPGVEVTVTRRAPLGDPIAIRLHGYELSLRCAEAGLIGVALAAGGM